MSSSLRSTDLVSFVVAMLCICHTLIMGLYLILNTWCESARERPGTLRISQAPNAMEAALVLMTAKLESRHGSLWTVPGVAHRYCSQDLRLLALERHRRRRRRAIPKHLRGVVSISWALVNRCPGVNRPHPSPSRIHNGAQYQFPKIEELGHYLGRGSFVCLLEHGRP